METDRLAKAQKAYAAGDVEGSRQAHTAEAVAKEEHARASGRYIGDIVYGAIDGIVTTFAVVSGVAGASLSSAIILILGFANLLADGLSMGIGNYIGTKSEHEYYGREREREAWEVEHMPEGEREEIREIFRKRGFTGRELERAVGIVTSDKDVWVETMMIDELNLIRDDRSPLKAGLATFAAFFAAGLMPLLAYILSYFIPFFKTHSFVIAIAATAVSLFAVGSARAFITGKRWWRSGLEILLVGGVAAVAAYLIGYLLSGLA